MPRKLTPEEIRLQKDFMYQKAVSLIKQKGLRSITVEDITDATQMAKGSFYKYYPSKEVFLYEVIKKNEKTYFELMLTSTKNTGDSKAAIRQVIPDTLLAEDSLFGYLLPEDLEYLMSRLPKEIQEKETVKSQNNFAAISKILGMPQTEENYATLSYLMYGLQTILCNPAVYGERGRNRAAKIIINAIADFILEEQTK